jgi:hypothetical protein
MHYPQVHLFTGSVLAENKTTGILEWHKIQANLVHPDLPNPACFHLTNCGRQVGGPAKAARSGHAVCATCGA